MPLPKDPTKLIEYKEKLRKLLIKRWENPEYKKRLSEKHKGLLVGMKNPMYGRTGDKNPNYGNKWTKEQKERQSKSHKGLFAGEKHPNFGKTSYNFKGGILKKRGYVFIYYPKHPFAVRNYVLEHRLIAEKCLKRYLTKKEIIHHINGIRNDNRPENLYLFESNSKHISFHRTPYFLVSNLISTEVKKDSLLLLYY